MGGGIEGKLGFHFTFGQFCFSQGKQLVCPPVQVPHCGLAVARMGGLKQAGRPPSAQNRWLCPQPATRAWVSNQSWDINRCLRKNTKRLQNPKPIATETQIILNIASFSRATLQEGHVDLRIQAGAEPPPSRVATAPTYHECTLSSEPTLI